MFVFLQNHEYFRSSVNDYRNVSHKLIEVQFHKDTYLHNYII